MNSRCAPVVSERRSEPIAHLGIRQNFVFDTVYSPSRARRLLACMNVTKRVRQRGEPK